MIDINKVNAGDCVYVLITVQNAPVFGEIVRVFESENAIEVSTGLWGNRVVIASNAYWEEKLAKKGKLVKIEHNYNQWAKEYFSDEETKTDNRINTVHNREPEETECKGQTIGNGSTTERSKRKQKVVRKSTERRRKNTRNRKTRSKKK